MHRKDFDLLASVIRGIMPNMEVTPEQVMSDLADALEKAYPNFDRAKFEEACDLMPERRVCVNTVLWNDTFTIDEMGSLSGRITGKSFRLLGVGDAFRFMSEATGTLADDGVTRLAWQGARGPWVKVGARSYRRLEDGHASGPTHVVGDWKTLCLLEPKG